MKVANASLVALVVSISAGDVASRPPTQRTERQENRPGVSGSPQVAQPKPAVDQRGTESSPAIVKVVPTPKSQDEIAQEQRDRDREARTENWTIGLAVLTVLAALLQFAVILRQAQISNRQNTIMETQNGIIEAQRRTTDAMLATNKAIERAYIGISPVEPGFIVSPTVVTRGADQTPKQELSFALRVENAGNTPATIDAVGLDYFLTYELPDTPPYGPPDPTLASAYLRKGEAVTVTKYYWVPAVTVDLFQNTQEPPFDQLYLWVVGFIEYTDAFETTHKMGFARRYDRALSHTANNMVLEGKVGYNYDTELG